MSQNIPDALAAAAGAAASAAGINLGRTGIADVAPALERLQAARRLSKTELKSLVDLARQHGGEVVNVSRFSGSDDDWCGTMWFRGPRPRGIGTLVAGLVDRGYGVRIFPYGIINPEALQVDIVSQVRAPGMR